MPDLPDDFAARVRAARAYGGYSSHAKFAAAVGGVSASTIKNYENGSHTPVERAGQETIRRLARASRLPEWFFTVPRLTNMHESTRRPTDERLDRIERAVAQVLALNRDVIAADLQELLQRLAAQPGSSRGGATNG